MTFEEKLQAELNKLPYTKHLDDGQYNDGVLSGFELGAYWAYNKALEDAAKVAYRTIGVPDKLASDYIEDGSFRVRREILKLKKCQP